MSTSAKKTRALLILFILGCLPAGVLRADGKMEPPIPVRTVAPEIPRELSRIGGSGLVTVTFMVDEQGGVKEPKVEKASDQMLEAPALSAVRKWKFKPAKKDGTPVPMRVSIPIKFEVE